MIEKINRRERELSLRKIIRIVLWILCGILLISGIYLILREYVVMPQADYVAPPTPTPITMPDPTPTPVQQPDTQVETTPEPTPTPYVKPIPIRLYFTDFELSCEVVSVGINADNEMETVDSPTKAAWLSFGPAPGENGNAIINGHNRFSGEAGYFSVLKQMEGGEEVVIEFIDGTFKYFTVESINTYKIADVPDSVMATDGEPRMTLITCLGDWDSSIGTSASRVVAVCKEVQPES